MRLFTTAIWTILPFITAAIASQVDTVYTDITALDQNVQTLTTAVQDYTGGLLPQSPLLIDLIQVHVSTRKGCLDATTLPLPLSDSDALRIIDYVNTTLAVDNPKAVEVLEGKKDLFFASGTGAFIKAGLEVLLQDHLDFSKEVLKRIPEDLLAEANAVVDVISNALQDGIAAFS